MEKVKDIILYVDDEESNLILFETIFSKYFNVIITTSTKEAREILLQHKIKVVLSDLRMPFENGIEFITNISPLYPDIYYIILTAYLDSNATMQAINQGLVYRYLLKPWDANEIIVAINNAILAYNLKSENANLLLELKEKNKQLEKTLAELDERQKQFYNIFFSSTDGIIIYNKNNEIILSNPVFNNFVHHIGRQVSKITDLLQGKALTLFNERSVDIYSQKLPITEYEIHTLKGEKRIIEVNSTVIQYFGEETILSILRDITDRKLMSQKILNEVIQAEERERNRLASDLHDGLGPTLSTLKMYIEWLSDKKQSINANQILDLSNKTILEAIGQLRTISHNLSPHVLEKFGLGTALQSQLELMKTTINFNLINEINDRLPVDIENTFFRIIKECMNNSIKHAKAKNATIRIFKTSDTLHINYSDDGIGFDPKATGLQSKGMGLYNIQNRIKSIGGEIELTSEIGQGAQFNMSVQLG